MMDPEDRIKQAFGIITDKGGSVTFEDDRIVVSSLDGDAEVHLISVRDNPDVSMGPDGTGHATASRIVVYIGDQVYDMPVDGTTNVELGGLGPLLGDADADR